MIENQYNPFIENIPEGDSVLSAVNKLDSSKTHVINEGLLNRYLSELSDQPKTEPILIKIREHSLIGENHAQVIPSGYQESFSEYLEAAEVFILEGLSPAKSLEGIRGQTFKGRAQNFALSHSKTIVDLNSETKRYYPTLKTLWLEKGITEGEIDIPVLESLSACLHYLLVEHTKPEVIKHSIHDFAQLTTGIYEKKLTGVHLSDEEQAETEEVNKTTSYIFNFAIQNPEGMNRLMSLIYDYNEVEAKIRDTVYNWLIRKTLNEKAGKSTLVVVGKNHFEASKLALSGENTSDEVLKELQFKAKEVFSKLHDLNNLAVNQQPI